KYALAFRRISLARRSSRISFSRSVMRCLSSVVIPGAFPESTWFCFTQLRRVFLLIPICSPTSRHAVLTARVGSLVSFSLTIRTARSRTSAWYLLGAGMILSSRLDQALHHTRGDPGEKSRQRR